MFYYVIYTYVYAYFISVLIYPPPTLTSPYSLSQSHRDNPSEGRQSLLMTQADCWELRGATGELSKLLSCLSERELFCVVPGLLLWCLPQGAILYLFLAHPSLPESKVMISTGFYNLRHEGLIHLVTSLFQQSFNETLKLSINEFFMAFVFLHWCSQVSVPGLRSSKPKIFIIWTFTDKTCWSWWRYFLHEILKFKIFKIP